MARINLWRGSRVGALCKNGFLLFEEMCTFNHISFSYNIPYVRHGDKPQSPSTGQTPLVASGKHGPQKVMQGFRHPSHQGVVALCRTTRLLHTKPAPRSRVGALCKNGFLLFEEMRLPSIPYPSLIIFLINSTVWSLWVTIEAINRSQMASRCLK